MAPQKDTVLRHAGIDRLFHWVMALLVTVLLATSLLPVIGVYFAWYTIHWIAGLLLTAIIAFHIVRALFWQRPARMLKLGAGDMGGVLAGKYTFAQKLMHLAWSVAILVAIVTGLLLLQKAGVPFLAREPYARSLATWGFFTLLHDLAALLSVFLILVHVYFGILPEKRGYLRAMIQGRMKRVDLATKHDLARVERGD